VKEASKFSVASSRDQTAGNGDITDRQDLRERDKDFKVSRLVSQGHLAVYSYIYLISLFT